MDDTVTRAENGFLDLHGREVSAFSMEMANVGFQRMAELLLSMLRSEAWRSFKDGLGPYAFLPGEFDYFLSQRGIRREDVMKIPDVDVKAGIEAAMNERRTGEDGYRRPVLQARKENPQRPGQPIEPFGITKAEAKALADGRATAGRPDRPALGIRVRRWSNTGGETTKLPSEAMPVPPAERLRRAALRLSDDDLADLIDSLKQEQRRRRRPPPVALSPWSMLNTEEENRAMQQITLISRLLEGDPNAIIHDYTVTGGTATLSYSLPLPADATVWKITLQTSKDAHLAKLAESSRNDQLAIDLAAAEAEISRLREARDIKARDWQDSLTINTRIEAERDEARAELAAARARLAELETADAGESAHEQ